MKDTFTFGEPKRNNTMTKADLFAKCIARNRRRVTGPFWAIVKSGSDYLMLTLSEAKSTGLPYAVPTSCMFPINEF